MLGLIHADASLAEPAISGLTYLRAEFVHSARHEMVETLVDLMCRRTRAHLMDARACADAAAGIAELVAGELEWDAARCRVEVENYQRLVTDELSAAGLPARATKEES